MGSLLRTSGNNCLVRTESKIKYVHLVHTNLYLSVSVCLSVCLSLSVPLLITHTNTHIHTELRLPDPLALGSMLTPRCHLLGLISCRLASLQLGSPGSRL